MKPHKHADVIKAWADGVAVEFRFKDGARGWLDWQPVKEDGKFISDPWWEYRIKPEAKPDIEFNTHIAWDLGWYWITTTSTKDSNLQLTFDGETGELKTAKVLK